MWGFSITGLHMLSCIMFLCVSSYSESIFHSGAVLSFQNVLSNPVLELIVRPGENVTLYCDCNSSTGVYIIWFRNCSHENQPTFVLETVEANPKKEIHHSYERKYLHYHFKWNISTSSYDLLINSISETHLGLYYCGTREKLTLDAGLTKFVYTYGNSTTRILLGKYDISVIWMFLFLMMERTYRFIKYASLID